MKYSFIVPVYNRPDEVDELLDSLTRQTVKDFEVIIVEDGSPTPCKDVCDKYAGRLDLRYFMKKNSGPGQSRNYGAERSKGEYLIVVSTLTDRESALLQLQKFHNNGVTEPIYLFEDGRRAYLYTHSFTQRKEAYTYLQKQLAGETPFPDAWVMRAGKSTTASPVVK